MGGKVQLGWESPKIQVSGRTQGDLITVFDLPGAIRVQDLLGCIVPVRVESAGPRLLQGRWVTPENPHEQMKNAVFGV